MKYIPAVVLLVAGLLVFSPGIRAQTEVRDDPPRVVFERLNVPETVSGDEMFSADIAFRLTQPVDSELKVFFHLVRPGQDRSVLNADFFPRVATSDWIVGQIMPAGPFNLAVPRGVEPGEYDIRAGLMEIVREEDRVRFVREPYANEDLDGFIVGSITVEETEEVVLELPPVIDLIDYEDAEEVLLWEPLNASLEPHNGKVLATLHPGVEYPAVALYNIFKLKPMLADWTYYDVMEIGLGLPPGVQRARIILQFTDRSGRKFTERLTLMGEEEIVREFDMVRLSGLLDLSRIEEVKIYTIRPQRDVSFLISRTRLLARDPVEERAAVTLVRLEGPSQVSRGEIFRLRPVFRINRPIYPEHKLFVHLYREHDLAGRVGTDIGLSPAIRFWPVDTEMAVDSAPLMISPDAPPGTYVVRAGLYLIAPATGEPYVKVAEWEDYDGEEVVPRVMQPSAPVDYIKQPYTNPDIREWEVGRITVD